MPGPAAWQEALTNITGPAHPSRPATRKAPGQNPAKNPAKNPGRGRRDLLKH